MASLTCIPGGILTAWRPSTILKLLYAGAPTSAWTNAWSAGNAEALNLTRMLSGAWRGVGWAVALAFGKSSESRSRSRPSSFARDRIGSELTATDPHGETTAGRRVLGASLRYRAGAASGRLLHPSRDH